MRKILLPLLFLILIFQGCRDIPTDNTLDTPNQDSLSLLSQVAYLDAEGGAELELFRAELAESQFDQIYLVIHCDATYPGREFTVERLQEFFRVGRGWSRPGYAFWIDRAGILYPLWPVDLDCLIDYSEITNGVRGKNSVSIHIAYSGGVDRHGRGKDTRTPEQILTLENFVSVVRNACPDVQVVGHRDLITDPTKMKDCPSFDVGEAFRD